MIVLKQRQNDLGQHLNLFLGSIAVISKANIYHCAN